MLKAAGSMGAAAPPYRHAFRQVKGDHLDADRISEVEHLLSGDLAKRLKQMSRKGVRPGNTQGNGREDRA